MKKKIPAGNLCLERRIWEAGNTPACLQFRIFSMRAQIIAKLQYMQVFVYHKLSRAITCTHDHQYVLGVTWMLVCLDKYNELKQPIVIFGFSHEHGECFFFVCLNEGLQLQIPLHCNTTELFPGSNVETRLFEHRGAIEKVHDC